MTDIAIENGPVGIVSAPIKNIQIWWFYVVFLRFLILFGRFTKGYDERMGSLLGNGTDCPKVGSVGSPEGHEKWCYPANVC